MIETETSLAQEQQAIPAAIDQAIDDADFETIIKLKKRRDEISLELIAHRLGEIKKLIKEKKQSQIDNHAAVEVNTLKRREVAIELDTESKVMEEIASRYNKLEFDAAIFQNGREILHEDLLALKQELADLKTQLRDGTSNGKSK